MTPTQSRKSEHNNCMHSQEPPPMKGKQSQPANGLLLLLKTSVYFRSNICSSQSNLWSNTPTLKNPTHLPGTRKSIQSCSSELRCCHLLFYLLSAVSAAFNSLTLKHMHVLRTHVRTHIQTYTEPWAPGGTVSDLVMWRYETTSSCHPEWKAREGVTFGDEGGSVPECHWGDYASMSVC